MFRISFVVSTLYVLAAMPALSWEVFVDKESDGTTIVTAEQIGEGGAFFNLVCFEQATHIEVVFPVDVSSNEDVAQLFQVDSKRENLVAGFIDRIDANTSVFIGIDRSDKPSIATPKIISEIKKGNELYLGDPDMGEGIERWSLAGASAAIRKMQKLCK